MNDVVKDEINSEEQDFKKSSDSELGVLVEKMMDLSEELKMHKLNDRQYEIIKIQVFDKILPRISIKGEKARLYAIDCCANISNNYIRNNLIIGLASANVVYDESLGRMRRVESIFDKVMQFLANSTKVELQGTLLSRVHTFCGHLPIDSVISVLDELYLRFDAVQKQEMVALLRPKGFTRGLFSWKFNKKGYDKDVSCPRCGLVFHKFIKRKGDVRYFRCSKCHRTNDQKVSAFER
ncbi:hypothetical protein JW935_05685 [candidate division KSB1 bacterium]|nr:hypothetical protein [candidate division KSB1 bacterium]